MDLFQDLDQRASGLSGRFHAGNADAFPANVDSDLSVVGDLRCDLDAGTADSAAGPDGDIAGFRYGDMVAYYLLVIISRAFSSMPGLTSGIANQIRNGEIKKFLIQPVDMQGCLLMQRIAHKLVYYLIATLPFALVFFLCRDFFVDGWPAGGCDGRFFRFADVFVPAGVLSGILHRTDRVLVSRSHLADVHLHADEFPAVGAHVSAGIAAFRTGQHSRHG